MKPFSIKSKVWLWKGNAAWHFVSIDTRTTKDIKKLYSHIKRGWGSLPVKVTIGKTTWKTSIFPDNKTGTYLLPLKKSVRQAEKIHADDMVTITLEIEGKLS